MLLLLLMMMMMLPMVMNVLRSSLFLPDLCAAVEAHVSADIPGSLHDDIPPRQMFVSSDCNRLLIREHRDNNH